MNPKSISKKLLYGDVDNAGEWHDGITPLIFRECAESSPLDQ